MIFKYVTFQGYSHFREAIFRKGLNLEYSNIENEMNFFAILGLDSKESMENTTQETYRIIKHQLQKVGNIIDANIYHSLELTKKREKVCSLRSDKTGKILDCITLTIHKVSSSFSTNWLYALLWILAVGIATNAIISGSLCEPKTWLGIKFYIFSYPLTPVEEFCGEESCSMGWLFIVNKILLGYLYYQFITAARKDTKKR